MRLLCICEVLGLLLSNRDKILQTKIIRCSPEVLSCFTNTILEGLTKDAKFYLREKLVDFTNSAVSSILALKKAKYYIISTKKHGHYLVLK
jgi:hypothetical protein